MTPSENNVGNAGRAFAFPLQDALLALIQAEFNHSNLSTALFTALATMLRPARAVFLQLTPRHRVIQFAEMTREDGPPRKIAELLAPEDPIFRNILQCKARKPLIIPPGQIVEAAKLSRFYREVLKVDAPHETHFCKFTSPNGAIILAYSLAANQQKEIEHRRAASRLLYPHLKAYTLRTLQSLRQKRLLGCLRDALAEAPFGVMLLSKETLHCIYFNSVASLACNLWIHGEPEGRSLAHNEISEIPRAILNACQEMARAAGTAEERYVDSELSPGLRATIRPVNRTTQGLVEAGYQIYFSLPPSNEEAGSNTSLADNVPCLSLREREILMLLTSGRSNKEIATSLNKSPHTVKNQIKSIYRKLGVESRYQLMSMLQSNGDAEMAG